MSDRWHITISGFLQHPHKPSGMTVLADEVRKIRDEKIKEGFNDAAYAPIRTWDSDWKAQAREIYLLAKYHYGSQLAKHKPIINLFGFSWGAGSGCMNLAKELDKYDFKVKYMVLSDPVYKNSFSKPFPRLAYIGDILNLIPSVILSPITLFKRRIRLPINVESCEYFTQNTYNKWWQYFTPKGSKILAPRDKELLINIEHIQEVPLLGHTDMDKYQPYLDLCLKRVKDSYE